MGTQLSFKERLTQAKEQAIQKNKRYIQQQQQALQDVKLNLQDFRQQLAATDKPNLQRQLQARIHFQEQQITTILGRLKNAGYTDKRGRPKKEVADTYKANRVKFTAHLQKEQMDYVQQLKKEGTIPNISAFLDELIEQHRQQQDS
ncbi:hypothetical protein [Sporosarcina sp. FSL K6-5500]|uniref:hypothetical protein n=1 Tax=Sporosarcina sp. FSL K6-5500 TaxID=2921558 RepID=UPI0030FCE940